MYILRAKNFKKMYKKMPPKVQTAFEKRLVLFVSEPEHPTLHIHSLGGEYKDMWSMNVTGDYRALFYREGDTVVIFVLIGTHSELYG